MTVERWIECEPCYGNGCTACGMKGRTESQEWRDDRDDHLERQADERRHDRLFGDDA